MHHMRLAFCAKVLTCGLAAADLLACQRPAPAPTPTLEKLPVLPSEKPAPPIARPDLRPPTRREVAEAMSRVFGTLPAEAYDAGHAVAGDFNGDGSADLAVPARVVDALRPDAKTGLANWIVQDPGVAPPRGAHPSPIPVTLVLGRPVLAVIHGHGPAGWRSPDARQVYLLTRERDEPLRVIPRARAAAIADPTRRPVRVEGDLLAASDGRRFLYWTGAAYGRR
jgi:hypothetical protein